jgi:transcriptional regulator with XRE-family HTH domain
VKTTNAAPIMTARAADVALRRYLEARATGRRVAWSREAAGLSQREVGAFVGFSQRTVSRVEHGERALRPAERAAVARALGTSIAALTAPGVELPAASNGNGRRAA